MAKVVVKNVYKKYEPSRGGITAVSDFNLSIEDKEFLVLLGPSGCGKTTTLRMIAGLEDITAGEIYIGDKLVNDVQPKDRDIAMVFQNYALYPHMTVFDNMAFGLKLRKTPKDEIKKRVHEAARVLEIEHLLDRTPKALSGGQRQRVALGRAIVREPKVFLMDEPLSNLDAKLRGQMRVELTKLHQRLQTTIIYVTHDQVEAMTMGTRIVCMRFGFIQQVDNPQVMYDYPANIYVAGFIGTPQMNFADASIKEEGKDAFVVIGNSKIKLPENRAKNIVGKGFDGKAVVIGIRPEALHDEQVYIDSMPDSTVSAKVEVVEMLGPEALIYCVIEGFNMIARFKPNTKARHGDIIKVAMDTERLHIFDKDTEKAMFRD
ncbi:MAG: sn-glycerol-3-phosphate ABC transporter ATP-binding protein UgpC [Clostridia bacterium]|nr:sn-glycerol-3-phosphate ABC transporter ATP-binding protein UgpC [Clostridia bacterium]